ncbi:uncharacterized protein LOC107363790 [Tetranychus urticae]|uniref:EB domain-containing protein n=1 Tax=Tetranychus urticae TaxID=32264 RepID=T1KEY1_TETUR|nr:uncharacterized protein LOC107363790 [Tetranychus urticae]
MNDLIANSIKRKNCFNLQIFSTLGFYLIILMLIDLPASGHIGQPCLPLGICWPLNIHIYCDENRTCRCRPETPVVVGPHACKRNKSHGDKCSSDQECLYSDNNSFCDNSFCNCVSNYTYDPFLIKCVHESVQQRSTFNIFYTMLSSAALWVILILITLVISIPCCLAFMYHCFCSDNTNGSDTQECRDTNSRLRYAESGGTARPASSIRFSLRQEDLVSRQSSYEIPSHDELPPTYEEAVKNHSYAPTAPNATTVQTMNSHNHGDTLDGPKNELSH